MTKQQFLAISCLTLMPVRHNGKAYGVGELVQLSHNDKFYLQKAGYLKEATPDEIANYERKMMQAQEVTPNANSNSHLDKQVNDSTDTKSDKNSLLDGDVKPVNDELTDELAKPNHETNQANQQKVDYDKLTKAELIAELTTRGITHNPKAKNSELVGLLLADDDKLGGE